MSMTTKTGNFHLKAYDASISSVASIVNENNVLGKGPENTSRADISATKGNTAMTKAFFSFDVSAIPEDATIDSVTCSARAYLSAPDKFAKANFWLFCGASTTKGDNVSFLADTSSYNSTKTFSGGTWTRPELESVYLRVFAQRGSANTSSMFYIYFFGATLTVTYTYQSEKFMLKLGGKYNDIARVFKKVSGIWVEQTELANVVDQTKRLVNGGEYVVELPEGYTRLEYIESTGSQYIDWGFKPNQDTRVVFQFYPVTTSGSYIFGSRASGSSSDKFAVLHPGGASNVRDDYGSEMTNVDILFNGLTIIDKNKNVTKIGGTTTTHVAASFESANLFLFANNTGGTAASMTSIQAVRAQAYKNGLPIRDSIPCLNPSGVPGFYDVMEDAFYGSASGTAFVPGPEYSGTISPGEPSEIIFVIGGTSHRAKSGMTWSEWMSSSYCTISVDPWVVGSETRIINDNYESLHYSETNGYVLTSDIIKSNGSYYWS